VTNKSDTLQGRVMLWRDGLQAVKNAPLFGIGYNTYADEVGQVAHNSYVHAYVELGFFGGTLFFSTFLLPILFLKRNAETKGIEKAAQLNLGPCIFSIAVAYAVGLFSLSRNYMTSTYLILGIACVFCDLISTPAKPVGALSYRLIQRVCVYSVLMVGFLYVFTRFVPAI
jgi:O-antigen ligase